MNTVRSYWILCGTMIFSVYCFDKDKIYTISVKSAIETGLFLHVCVAAVLRRSNFCFSLSF